MDVCEQRGECSGKCNVIQGTKWVLYALRMPHSEWSGFSDSRLCREFNGCTWWIECSESDDAVSEKVDVMNWLFVVSIVDLVDEVIVLGAM